MRARRRGRRDHTFCGRVETRSKELVGLPVLNHLLIITVTHGRGAKQGQDMGLHLGKPDSVMSRMVDAAEAADSGLLHWVRARSTHAYLDIVLTKTDFEREYDRVRDRQDVSRHGIAHGFQIQGYTWLNSLRLFLLLDTLYSLLWATEQTTTVGGVAV